MEDLQLQLERLRRHFEACSEEYDAISLLDLAHSLRVVGEYKLELNKHFSEKKGLLLPHQQVPKRVKRVLRKLPFVMALFPNAVNLKTISCERFMVVFSFLSDTELRTVNSPDNP